MEFRKVPVDLIDFNDVGHAARPVPTEKSKDWPKFLVTKASIAQHGIQNFFTVRKNGERFKIGDGTGRLLAVKMLMAEGHQPTIERYSDGIPVNVIEQSDIDALACQITGNHAVRQQKDAAFANALFKYMNEANCTLQELSDKTCIALAELEKILTLKDLPAAVQAALNEKKISLTNAYQLAKMDNSLIEEDLEQWLADAATKSTNVFGVQVANAINAARKAKRGEGQKKATEFNPTQVLLKKEDLGVLYERSAFDFENADENDVAAYNFAKGFRTAMLTIFQMDEKSVADRKAKWEADIKAAEEKAADRKAKREVEQAREAVEFVKKTNPDLLKDLVG